MKIIHWTLIAKKKKKPRNIAIHLSPTDRLSNGSLKPVLKPVVNMPSRFYLLTAIATGNKIERNVQRLARAKQDEGVKGFVIVA